MILFRDKARERPAFFTGQAGCFCCVPEVQPVYYYVDEVNTACCSGGIPKTLTGTFTDGTGGCAIFNGVELVMTHRKVAVVGGFVDVWIGENAVDGPLPINGYLKCCPPGDPNEPLDWEVRFQCYGPLTAPCNGGFEVPSFNNNPPTVACQTVNLAQSVVCEPLTITGKARGFIVCCSHCHSANTIRLVVTE
jgi:hypothetical protein